MTFCNPRLMAVLLAAIALSLLAVSPTSAVQIELDPPGEREFVLDLAGLLDANTKSRIQKFCERLLNEKATPIIVVTMVVGMVVAFIVGAVVGSRIGWLRRLFTSRKQMLDEVALRARTVFFDRRVHHTNAATGILIYVSLYERLAHVLADQKVMEKLGQDFLNRLCHQLTDGLRQGNPTDAICAAIRVAGKELSGPLPRTEPDDNELVDSFVLID